MTGLGNSPPRPKKVSCDDGEPEVAAVTTPRDKEVLKRTREHAKEMARVRRTEVRENVRAAKAQARSGGAAARAGRKSDSQTARQEARDAKAAQRATRRDRIVEAPREPKKPLAQKLRRGDRVSHADTAPQQVSKSKGPRRPLLIAAGVLGVSGLICSITLAVGALLVALGADGSSLYDSFETVCNALVGPLRDVFTFSGTNAGMKEALVAWGAGSIGYLLIGIVGQSVLRSLADD